MSTSRSDILKILVVDDSDFNRQTIVNILTEEGFNVVGQASNAEEAIQITYNTRPNLILVDVVMPEISGIELTKYLLEKSGNDRFVIMMSSLNIESVVIESISNGAIDFLTKPFQREELVKAVERIESIIPKDNKKD